MKVALDTRWIFPELSGVGVYTQALLAHFGELAPDIEFVLLFDNPATQERVAAALALARHPNLQPCRVPYGVFAPRGQLALPGLLRTLGIDVFHSPNYMIPLLAFPAHRPGRIRCAVTLHDLIPLVLPDHAPRSRKRRLFPLYRGLMHAIAARADAILTVSAASRADIVRLLTGARGAGRVRVIPNGVDPRFQPAGPGAPAAPGPRRILYVGRADPYKNLVVLVDAFAELRRRGHADLELVLAGSPDPRYPEAGRRAAALGVDAHVRWTGYLDPADLLAQYRQAAVLAHPSSYEGFGLQVVEAMACGTPVVCTRAASLPEVAGDAALFAETGDAASLAAQLHRVLTDPTLAGQLRARGLEQARRFSWRRAAEATLAVYRELAAA